MHGRWSLVERTTDAGETDVPDRTAGQLLARYGIVFRELVARERFRLVATMGARGRARVLEKFSLDAEAGHIAEVYRGLAIS